MKSGNPSVFERMDSMYRPQKHIYDVTRKYYLFGRDRLLRNIGIQGSAPLIDVGCGTGRNLTILAKLYPQARLIGLEPSGAMLEVAEKRLARAGLGSHVQLVQGIAGDLPQFCLNGMLPAPEHVIFSYSLSIMPDAISALDHARHVLAPGGQIHIVDFGDMAAMPKPAAKAMHAWLAKFGVSHKPAISARLADAGGQLRQDFGPGRYYELMHWRYALDAASASLNGAAGLRA